MIEVTGLTKWYGPVRALEGVSFGVERGQVVGFLGPNGAGKSTTLRILTGYLPPTAGRATINGRDVSAGDAEARRLVGYLPENTPLYGEMRVEEYLHFRGRLFGMDRRRRRERIGVVVDRCGLVPVRRRVIARLSKGNRQRVGLAQAMLHDPPVLILDEPTAGLDPTQIGEVRRLIRELGEGHTVLLSSHILPEVERTADRAVVIAGGRIVADGTLAELRGKPTPTDGNPSASSVRVEVRCGAGELERVLRGMRGVKGVKGVRVEGLGGGWVRGEVWGEGDLREGVARAVMARGWGLRELTGGGGNGLEEMFVGLTSGRER